MIFNKVARPISCILLLFSCNNSNHNTKVEAQKDTAHTCMQVPQRFGANSDSSIGFGGDSSYVNMVLIPGGSFEMGGDNDQAAEDEFPKHKVTIASTNNYTGAFWNILPTFNEIAGVDALPKTDGISFVNALKNKKQKAHDCLYWEFYEGGFKQAILQNNWKAIRYYKGTIPHRTELYNL